MSFSADFSCSCSIAPEKADHVDHTNIDADVLRTPHTNSELLNQQTALENRKQNMSVPAINLPPEILTVIFEFACSSDDDDWAANTNLHTEEYPVNASAVTPLFIGSICSAWRNIAWGASQLWSSITLIYNEEEDEKLAEMLDYWLSKSGKRPLTVKLFEDLNIDTMPVTAESVEVINVVAAYAHRLHTLFLFLPEAWEPALIRIASCVPLLARLSLSPFYDEGIIFVQVGDLFANAPRLREVTLSGYSVTDLSLPWTQLESLKSEYYHNVLEPLETLRLCPRLRRFSFYLNNLSWTVPPSVLVRHTALEALEMIDYDEFEHPEFFKMLELPTLRSFVLHLRSMPRELSSWMPSFLSRVAGTLETLDLTNSCLSDEELLTVLQVVPRLRRLVLRNVVEHGKEKGLTQKVLDLMNPNKYEGLECEGIGHLDGEGDGNRGGAPGRDERRNGRCLVPNLETFQFEGKIAFTSHVLVEFLVARWRGCLPPNRCTSDLSIDHPHNKSGGRGKKAALDRPLRPNLNAPSARLRSVTFKIPEQIPFDDADAEVVQGLRLEGMHLEFRTDFCY